MKIEELNKETIRDLYWCFYFPEAMKHPEEFREIGLDPQMVGEIQRKLLSLSLEILSEEVEEGDLISQCIGVLGGCTIEDSELHESILDCLMRYMDRELAFAAEAIWSLVKLMDIVSRETWESRIPHLVDLLETGGDESSWNGAYALISLAPKIDRKFLQSQIGRILNIAKSNTGSRKAHAVSALGKLYQYADSKEEILDTLFLAAQDPDENTRRASIFALEDCISNGTKGKIFNLFENLLEDKAKSVKYGALEALTEVLPYKISDKSFDRILEFLQADEQWIRWRVALALNKAYPELDAKQKEKAAGVLAELIKDEDIFVKVRAYEALLNIKDLEKKTFPEIDKALKEESDFVRQWVLYDFAYS
jgi:AcrR family transcriptional regulator